MLPLKGEHRAVPGLQYGKYQIKECAELLMHHTWAKGGKQYVVGVEGWIISKHNLCLKLKNGLGSAQLCRLRPRAVSHICCHSFPHAEWESHSISVIKDPKNQRLALQHFGEGFSPSKVSANCVDLNLKGCSYSIYFTDVLSLVKCWRF